MFTNRLLLLFSLDRVGIRLGLLFLKETLMQRESAQNLLLAANRSHLPIQSDFVLLDLKLHCYCDYNLSIAAVIETAEKQEF